MCENNGQLFGRRDLVGQEEEEEATLFSKLRAQHFPNDRGHNFKNKGVLKPAEHQKCYGRAEL